MFSFNRAVLVILSGTFALAAAVSCGSSSDTSTSGTAGSTTTGSGGTGGTGGAALYGTSECGTCVETKACLAQLNACAADPSCAAYLECLDKCPLGPNGDADTTCEKACPAVSGSAAQAAKDDFVKCRAAGAGSQCAGCGKIDAPTNPIFHQMCPAEPPPEDANNKCYSCEDVHCCDTYQTCHVDADCKALGDCVQVCANGPKAQLHACQDKCYQDHPAGYPKYGDRRACLTYFCADNDACGNVPLDPCVACLNVHCADANAACAHDLQCTLLLSCQVPCDASDSACFAACEKKFPAGADLLKTWTDCGVANCTIACGGSMP